MLYITSFVLIYLLTGNLYLMTAFTQFPLLPIFVSGNHKSELFLYEFVYLFVSIVDLQYYVSSHYTTQWFSISIHFKMITTSLPVTIQTYNIVTQYISHTIFFISVCHLFCNWKFVPLNLPHLFLSSTTHTILLDIGTFLYSAAAAKLLQSCPTLCNPIDGSPPGSTIPGILQARTLEWVAISFWMHESENWKWSHSVMSDSQRPHGLKPIRLLLPWDFPGKSTGVRCQ